MERERERLRKSERLSSCGRKRSGGNFWGEGVKGLLRRAGGQCPRARYRWQHKRARNPSAIFLLPIVSPPPPVSRCTVYTTTAVAKEEEKEKEEKKYRRRSCNDII